MSDEHSTSVSLDPAGWTTHRRVAHEALNLVLDYQRHIAGQPAWRPMPPETEERLQAPLPTGGEGVANTNHRTQREDFDRLVEETVRLGEHVTGGRMTTAIDG